MTKTPLIMGIIFAFLNALMLSSMSLFGKLLAPYFGPIEVTFWRNIISLAILFIWLLSMGNLSRLKTKRPFAHLLRGSIGTAGIVCGMWALSLLPLAETMILYFTSPLFVVLLSRFVLKEQVGLHRLGAVCIGFIGVIIAIYPGLGTQTLPVMGVIAGLLWSILSACVDICLRWMGSTENSNATVFYFTLLGTLITALHWPFAHIEANSFSPEAFLIIAGLGLSGVLALSFKTQSFRLVEASTLAPIMYTMFIWTILFDYLFWDRLPTWNALCGVTIIIIAQLYILRRESRFKKKEAL